MYDDQKVLLIISLTDTTGSVDNAKTVYFHHYCSFGGFFLSVAVASPTDEMKVEPGMKLDLHINHFSNTTAAVTPQAHQGPEHNLAVQTGG